MDLYAIASDLGLEVEAMPLGDISGKIARTDRGEYPHFKISVNSDHHPNRRRYTLAHEIAHFMLHRDLIGDGITDDAMYRSALDAIDREHEREANRLAADILMPVSLLAAEWRLNRDIDHLARRFEVSRRAMEIRVEWLRERGRLR